ncbi:MAG: PTS sugar transporter subunit IIA [Rhodopila sp.]|jgi:PTS system nitrogen regulatory IIA component
MEIVDFLTPERVLLDVRGRDKGQLIGDIARHFGRLVPTLKPETVETALLAREQLGSTGLGAGFALPHARIEDLRAYLGMFVRLAKPIDFDAIDGKPVQLVFVLLIPSDTVTPHVAALAAISRRFRDSIRVTNLLKSKTPAEAYGFLTDI